MSDLEYSFTLHSVSRIGLFRLNMIYFIWAVSAILISYYGNDSKCYFEKFGKRSENKVVDGQLVISERERSYFMVFMDLYDPENHIYYEKIWTRFKYRTILIQRGYFI